MTKKGRRRLFYSLVAVFFLVGAGAIFYAQGWRFDFTSLTFKKIGAIYIRAYPPDADIYLDGKAVRSKNGIFTNGTLVNNLIPKNYILELKAQGYEPWREYITVQPSLVSEVKYAVLVPQKPVVVQSDANQIINFFMINHAPLIEDDGGD